jgi:hypothetical protein
MQLLMEWRSAEPGPTGLVLGGAGAMLLEHLIGAPDTSIVGSPRSVIVLQHMNLQSMEI